MLRDQVLQVFSGEESAVAFCCVGNVLALLRYCAGFLAGQSIRPAVLGMRLKMQRFPIGRETKIFGYGFVVCISESGDSKSLKGG